MEPEKELIIESSSFSTDIFKDQKTKKVGGSSGGGSLLDKVTDISKFNNEQALLDMVDKTIGLVEKKDQLKQDAINKDTQDVKKTTEEFKQSHSTVEDKETISDKSTDQFIKVIEKEKKISETPILDKHTHLTSTNKSFNKLKLVLSSLSKLDPKGKSQISKKILALDDALFFAKNDTLPPLLKYFCSSWNVELIIDKLVNECPPDLELHDPIEKLPPILQLFVGRELTDEYLRTTSFNKQIDLWIENESKKTGKSKIEIKQSDIYKQEKEWLYGVAERFLIDHLGTHGILDEEMLLDIDLKTSRDELPQNLKMFLDLQVGGSDPFALGLFLHAISRGKITEWKKSDKQFTMTLDTPVSVESKYLGLYGKLNIPKELKMHFDKEKKEVIFIGPSPSVKGATAFTPWIKAGEIKGFSFLDDGQLHFIGEVLGGSTIISMLKKLEIDMTKLDIWVPLLMAVMNLKSFNWSNTE